MLAKDIFNAFYNLLSELTANDLITTVTKTGIDAVSEDDYNAIEVKIGSDQRQDLDKNQYMHDLTINVDIHVKDVNKNIDDITLDIRELIENKIYSVEYLALDYVFRVVFVSQSQPSYNESGIDYKSSTRLDFLISYFKQNEF